MNEQREYYLLDGQRYDTLEALIAEIKPSQFAESMRGNSLINPHLNYDAIWRDYIGSWNFDKGNTVRTMELPPNIGDYAGQRNWLEWFKAKAI